MSGSVGWVLVAFGVLVSSPGSRATLRLEWLIDRERGDPTRSPAALLGRWPGRRVSRPTELGVVVRAITDELRAGASVATALGWAARGYPRFQDAFAEAARRAQRGDDPAPVLARHLALRPLAVAIDSAGRTGAPVVELLQGIQAGLRSEHDVRVAVRTALAGPRASALLLAFLPLIGVAMGLAVGADPFGFWLGTRAGVASLGLGLLLDALGILWTAALARRAQL